MQVETKYDIGDKVYALEAGKSVVDSFVTKIYIEVSAGSPWIKYETREHMLGVTNGNNPVTFNGVSEKDLFETPEEVAMIWLKNQGTQMKTMKSLINEEA